MKPIPRCQALSFFLLAAYLLAGCSGVPFQSVVFAADPLGQSNISTVAASVAGFKGIEDIFSVGERVRLHVLVDHTTGTFLLHEIERTPFSIHNHEESSGPDHHHQQHTGDDHSPHSNANPHDHCNGGNCDGGHGVSGDH